MKIAPVEASEKKLNPSPKRRKPNRSLRIILTWWFLIFSIVPLTFVTVYSLMQFQSAVTEELTKRLRGNSREFEVVISNLEKYLQSGSRTHVEEPSFVYNVNTVSVPAIRKQVSNIMRTYQANRISVFDHDGRLVVAMMKSGDSGAVALNNLESGDVFLSETILKQLTSKKQVVYRDARAKFGIELVVYTNIVSSRRSTIGYLEETINLDQNFVTNLKKNLGLDVILFDSELRPIVSTQPDFILHPTGYYKDNFGKSDQALFDIEGNGQPYGVMMTRIKSDEGNITIGLAVSKRDIKNLTDGINRALFSIVGLIIILLAITLFAASNMILTPLQRLVEGAERIEAGEFGAQIPIESQTEIGLLTESFNQMSTRIAQARDELQSKLVELEKAYKEVQNTQAQLVQTAKMVSLGQLVAGVAHELNNPIGFIYSNMEHLREYSQNLLKLVEVAEQSPHTLSAVKKELDYDYLVSDLPRLIKACEDGARRVRDIVVGLRNFSRLDEYQLKEVNLEEGLQTTLDLLSGELKNRINVHRDFGNIPDVRCYANQINQVFMNLISNAAQAIDGEGDIWIKTEKLNALKVRISVRDSGNGIPGHIRDKIFDPFFTTKPVGEGTGLGLSISYGIIKKHGGDIFVTSTEGKGATFFVDLPVQLESNS